jgi:AcrR family transcriptional regulator
MTGVAASRSLKEKQRAEREDLILQVADEILAEKGFHDTSMDEIAQRVGVSKGTVYLHFAKKEDLVLALAMRYAQTFLKNIEQIFASALGPRAKLEAILRFICGSGNSFQWIVALKQNPEIQKIFNERHEQWHQSGDTQHESFHQVGERFVTEVRTLLEAGKTTGEFDATLPTEVMMSTFIGLLPSSLMYQRLRTDTQMPPEELAEYLGRIYFKGIAAH